MAWNILFVNDYIRKFITFNIRSRLLHRSIRIFHCAKSFCNSSLVISLKSLPLFLWPIPRSRFMSFLAPNCHLEIRTRHRELRLASTVCYKRHGWCTLPRSLSQTKRNDFRIRQVKDRETILPHTLSSLSYHFTKSSLNPNVVKLVEVGSTYPFFNVCIHYLWAVSFRVEIIFGRFSKFFETFKPLQNFRVR